MSRPVKHKCCSVCGAKHYALGFCARHYHQRRRKTDIENKRVCSIDGCGKPHAAKGLCLKHWKKQRQKEALGLTPRQLELVDWVVSFLEDKTPYWNSAQHKDTELELSAYDSDLMRDYGDKIYDGYGE